MEVDLDKPVTHLPPWDFTVKIGGVVYATREPSREQVMMWFNLQRIEADQVWPLVWSLFRAPFPDPVSLGVEGMYLIMASVRGYLDTRILLTAFLEERAKAKRPAPVSRIDPMMVN